MIVAKDENVCNNGKIASKRQNFITCLKILELMRCSYCSAVYLYVHPT